jgi:hypothetical protein
VLPPAPARLERARVVRAGVGVGEEAAPPVAGPHEIMHCPLALAAAGVVLGDLLERLVSAPGRQPLEGRARTRMQLGPGPEQQALVGHLLDQEVAEPVRQLGEQILLVEQLEAHQLVDWALEVLAAVRERLHERQRELAAEHGGELQRALEGLRQPVDAGSEQVVHGPWHLAFRQLAPERRPVGAGHDEIVLAQIARSSSMKKGLPSARRSTNCRSVGARSSFTEGIVVSVADRAH